MVDRRVPVEKKMKISKTPTKKLAEPSKELLEFMSSLTIERLYKASLELDDNGWNFPKSDLFHWVSYLNQWDVVLESTILKYDLKQIQKIDFTIEDQEMIKGILKLEWYLWENCTNRNLYNSYEHLKDLLNSTDLEIIFYTLKLLTRPASRTSSQRNLKNIFSQMTPTLTIIAQGWGQELSDFGIFKLDQEFKQTLYDKFYMDKVVTISEDLSKYHPKDCREIFEDIKTKYQVPKEKEYGIFFKIRVLKDVNDLEKRKIWGSSRLLALSICCKCFSIAFCCLVSTSAIITLCSSYYLTNSKCT
jgi:E3 ubiquitin-protein ligase HUWE1